MTYQYALAIPKAARAIIQYVLEESHKHKDSKKGKKEEKTIKKTISQATRKSFDIPENEACETSLQPWHGIELGQVIKQI